MKLDHSSTWLLVLFLLLSLVHGVLYVALVPPWQAPDEPKHFEYVRLLYDKRRSVDWSDIDPTLEQEIIQSMDRYDYWRFGRFNKVGRSFNDLWGGASHKLEQPSLAYLLYVPLLFLLPPHETALQLYAFRLMSVLLATLVVLLAYLTARELFPDDPVMQVGVPAFVALLPMHTFLTSSLNSDHLAEALVSLSLFLLVRIFRRGLSVGYLVGIGVAILLAALAKRTSLFMVLSLVAAIPLYLASRNYSLSWGKALLIGLSLVMGLVTLGIASIGRIEEMLTGTSPGLAAVVHDARVYYFFLPSQQFPLVWDKGYLGSEALAIYRHWIGVLFRSFWGNFGWLNLPLRTGWYQVLGVACLISLVGLLWLAIRAKRVTWLARWQTGVLLSFGLAILFSIGMIYAKHIRSLGFEWAGAPQGRWLFPLVIPIAILLLTGWRALVPGRVHHRLLYAWIASLVILDWVVLLRYIVPFYYGY